MRPKGTIYQYGKSALKGEVVILLPFFLRLTYHLARGLGAGMIAFSFLAFAFSFGPIIEQEIAFKLNEKGIVSRESATADLDYALKLAEAERVSATQEEAKVYGVDSYFSVVIPKIDAKSNVVANVDVSDKSDYLEALKRGIAHARGTYFPGQDGTVFLFSHSTDSPLNFARYNAVFYLLRRLEEGDRIIVFFADRKYEYEVAEIARTDPADTSWLVPKKEGEKLILMTCDPPGTTWNRLLVVAHPISR